MKKGILAKKIGMTQIFMNDGKVVPVTVLSAGPCTVVQKKTVETDGYDAIKVAYGDIREKLVNKPLKGEFAKANAEVARVKAQGQADAKKIAAEAEAEANKMIAKSLNDNVLKNKWYEKWNGKYPQVVSDGGTIIEFPMGE